MNHQHFTIACEGCGTRIGGCRCMEGGGNLKREGYCPECKALAPAPAAQGVDTREAERIIYEQFKRRGCFDPAQEVADLLSDLKSAGFAIHPQPGREEAK